MSSDGAIGAYWSFLESFNGRDALAKRPKAERRCT